MRPRGGSLDRQACSGNVGQNFSLPPDGWHDNLTTKQEHLEVRVCSLTLLVSVDFINEAMVCSDRGGQDF